jgi:hypothetical protein
MRGEKAPLIRASLAGLFSFTGPSHPVKKTKTPKHRREATSFRRGELRSAPLAA